MRITLWLLIITFDIFATYNCCCFSLRICFFPARLILLVDRSWTTEQFLNVWTECVIISTLVWNSFSLLHTKPRNIFNYFQWNAYSELIKFWYYTLLTTNFICVIEKLKITHLGYLFDEECNNSICNRKEHLLLGDILFCSVHV